MLSLLDITSMFHIVTIFVIVLQTVVLIWCIAVHMIYHHFSIPYFTWLLIITMKAKAKENIYTASILLFYITQKYYCPKDSIFF